MFCVGCFDNEGITTPVVETPINLGPVSTSTKIISTSSIVVDDKVSVVLAVSAGSKYSLQLTNLPGKMVYNYGFTAGGNNTVVTLNLSEVTNGDYQLILMDTNGTESKTPLIIKH